MSADTGLVDAVMRYMGGKGGRAEMEGLLARLEATKPCYSNWCRIEKALNREGEDIRAFAHTLIDSLLPFSPSPSLHLWASFAETKILAPRSPSFHFSSSTESEIFRPEPTPSDSVHCIGSRKRVLEHTSVPKDTTPRKIPRPSLSLRRDLPRARVLPRAVPRAVPRVSTRGETFQTGSKESEKGSETSPCTPTRASTRVSKRSPSLKTETVEYGDTCVLAVQLAIVEEDVEFKVNSDMILEELKLSRNVPVTDRHVCPGTPVRVEFKDCIYLTSEICRYRVISGLSTVFEALFTSQTPPSLSLSLFLTFPPPASPIPGNRKARFDHNLSAFLSIYLKLKLNLHICPNSVSTLKSVSGTVSESVSKSVLKRTKPIYKSVLSVLSCGGSLVNSGKTRGRVEAGLAYRLAPFFFRSDVCSSNLFRKMLQSQLSVNRGFIHNSSAFERSSHIEHHSQDKIVGTFSVLKLIIDIAHRIGRSRIYRAPTGFGQGDLFRLVSLPVHVMENVVSFLENGSKQALARTSHAFRQVVLPVAIGLKCTLKGHQRVSLLFMLEREKRLSIHPSDTKTLESRDDHSVSRKSRNAREWIQLRIMTTKNKIIKSEVEKRCFPDKVHIHSESGKITFKPPKASKTVRSSEELKREAQGLGGFLCDEPGLGKTVTILALALATNGYKSVKYEGETIEEAIRTKVKRYWKTLGKASRRRLVVKLLSLTKKINSFIAGSGCISMRPKHHKKAHEEARRLAFELVENTGCNWEELIRTLREAGKVEKHLMEIEKNPKEFGKNPKKSEKFPKRSAKKSRKSSKKGGKSKGNSTWLDAFERALERFEIKTARPRCRFNSYQEFPTQLKACSSGTTLVVVPKPLVQHWGQQFERHVHWDAIGSKGLRGAWIDPDSKGILPGVCDLQQHLIVLTSFQRLTNEKRRNGRNSVLRKIKFLRLVVDEGHSVGRSTRSDYVDFLNLIAARSRWVATGTPFTLSKPLEDLRTLEQLFQFIRYPIRDWKNLAYGAAQACPGAIGRIGLELSRVMVRHTKEDAKSELPYVDRKVTRLKPSPLEVRSYNTLVSVVKMNLITSSMGDAIKGWKNSLLNPSNSHFARKTLQNLRESCCGGGEQSIEVDSNAESEVIHELESYWRIENLNTKRGFDVGQDAVTKSVPKSVSVSVAKFKSGSPEHVERAKEKVLRFVSNMRNQRPGRCKSW
ncbi:hypothetical protein AAMO2058_001399100 [Amorphochlora amoebiformis]